MASSPFNVMVAIYFWMAMIIFITELGGFNVQNQRVATNGHWSFILPARE